jgi:hypothetical protein
MGSLDSLLLTTTCHQNEESSIKAEIGKIFQPSSKMSFFRSISTDTPDKDRNAKAYKRRTSQNVPDMGAVGALAAMNAGLIGAISSKVHPTLDTIKADKEFPEKKVLFQVSSEPDAAGGGDDISESSAGTRKSCAYNHI